MSTKKPVHVKSRNENFKDKTATNIWYEKPSADNPYLAAESYCQGYKLRELLEKRSFVDVFYLLFMGELPSADKSQLLEQLMIAFINPGPRHPSTQAAMNAGISKVRYCNILPISLAIHGGAYLGGSEVEQSMRFFHSHHGQPVEDVVNKLIQENKAPEEGDWHICPGLGTHFGSIDFYQHKLAKDLQKLSGAGHFLAWGQRFVDALAPHNMGWLSTGVAAAALCDLGFHPRTGAGLFQLFNAPGLLAHGLEMSTQPLTAMPFLDDKHYEIKK